MPRRAVVQLIAGKEFRDLLRDRRTVLLILVLPAVLYPLFGAVGWFFVTSLIGNPSPVTILGVENLPPPAAGYPALLTADGTRFAPGLEETDADPLPIVYKVFSGESVESLLASRKADALIIVPSDFSAKLESGALPKLELRFREGDDKGKLASRRLAAIVQNWGNQLRAQRFAKAGLRPDFDKIFQLEDPQTDKPRSQRAADDLRDTFAKAFPFILMMWLVAGAIQPAVDMTAGEKERGTMETLLISPAERSEIVFGKFTATGMFAFLSVVWNVLWLTGAAIFAESLLGSRVLSLPGVLGCLLLGLPLALFFSAVCVALGVFAKSTKEGQYYLLPLVLVAMPLAFWSMTPGAEIGANNFWIPITGAMLLQQKFLAVSGEPIPWHFLFPVLAAQAAFIGLAMLFAVWQFRRESVLFTEDGPQGSGVVGFFRGMMGRS